MSNFHDPEGNQDIFDVATIIVAGVFGGIGAVVIGSPEVGAIATGVMAVGGISATRFNPVRRKVESATEAFTPPIKGNAKGHSEADL